MFVRCRKDEGLAQRTMSKALHMKSQRSSGFMLIVSIFACATLFIFISLIETPLCSPILQPSSRMCLSRSGIVASFLLQRGQRIGICTSKCSVAASTERKGIFAFRANERSPCRQPEIVSRMWKCSYQDKHLPVRRFFQCRLELLSLQARVVDYLSPYLSSAALCQKPHAYPR